MVPLIKSGSSILNPELLILTPTGFTYVGLDIVTPETLNRSVETQLPLSETETRRYLREGTSVYIPASVRAALT